MPEQIYELNWKVMCLEFEFGETKWKVFDSEAKAQAYGRQKQDEWNDGLPPCEKANDGYCYQFMGAFLVDEVDGYGIMLLEKGAKAHGGEKFY